MFNTTLISLVGLLEVCALLLTSLGWMFDRVHILHTAHLDIPIQTSRTALGPHRKSGLPMAANTMLELDLRIKSAYGPLLN